MSAGLLLAGVFATSTPVVHTSTADVRDCAVSDSGDLVLAATDGGVVAVAADGSRSNTLTAAHGLPGTRSEALLQIDSSHWWVGTEGGLARLRVAAGVVEMVERIDGPRVRALAFDGDGVLVGTWGQGVMRLEAGRLTPVPFSDDEPSAARMRVTALERYGDQWIVATAAGLWRGDEEGLSRWSTPLDETIVWSLAEVEGQLWVGTLDGLFRGRDRLRRVAMVDARDLDVHDDTVRVATAGEGTVVFGASTARRLADDRDHGLVVHATAHHDRRRCAATEDGLWLDDGPGTSGSTQLRGALPSNDISAAAWDPSKKRLWVGTFDRGLAYHDEQGWHRVEAPELDPQINALAVQRTSEGSALWVATARGVVRILDGDVQAWTRKAGLPHDHALSLAVAGDEVLVGTARGFVTLAQGEVVAPDRRREPGRWAVWSIAVDDDGTRWLGTTEGLIEWPLEGPWRRHSMLEGSLPDNWVTALQVDDDALWVGTYAEGVVHLSRGEGGTLERTDLEGGRVNPAGLTLTRTHVYASTMAGLKRRPRGRGGRWSSVSEGLPGRDTTAVVRTPAGRWITTRRGLTFVPR